MKYLSEYKYLFSDLDGTLIKTATGGIFAKDCTDFRIRKEVVDKIKDMFDDGALEAVHIVSNQGGIPKYMTMDEFLAKQSAITAFIESYTNCAVTASFCTSLEPNEPFRKPNTGMFENKVKEEDKPLCLMIGDASGKDKGYWGSDDVEAARNFGIDYLDVEDFLKAEV